MHLSLNDMASFFGNFWNIFKNNPISNLFKKYTGSGLTTTEQQMNDFNAEQADINRLFQSHEAALQRDWSAQEAERARDWQEEMYAKYNSLSGKIAQAESAGVNPLFAVTGNSVTPMNSSSPVPSGASAGSVGNPSANSVSGQFTDLVGSILGLSKLKAEVDNINAQTSEVRARAEKTSKETSWLDRLSEAELENRLMSTAKIQSDIGVNDVTANKLSAEANKLKQEGLRISKITDFEVKQAEANALIAEFQSSVYRIASDWENANTGDYIQMGVFLLEKLIGIGVSLSPRGIVHMN